MHVDEIDISPEVNYDINEDCIIGLSTLPKKPKCIDNKLIAFTLSSMEFGKQCVLSFDIRSSASPDYKNDFKNSLLRNIAAFIENGLELEALILDQESHLNSVLDQFKKDVLTPIATICAIQIRIINDYYHIM